MVKKGDQHRHLKDDPDLLKLFQNCLKGVHKKKKQKYEMGTSAASSVAAASSGMFTKQAKYPSKLSEANSKKNKAGKLAAHNKGTKGKHAMEQRKMELYSEQTEAVVGMSKALYSIGRGTEFYFGDMINWVAFKYQPQSNVKAVLGVIESNNHRFTCAWQAVQNAAESEKKKLDDGDKKKIIDLHLRLVNKD